MNKSYRLIYNEITNTWVAVAETAKARGKRAAGVVLLAAASAVLGIVPVTGYAAPPNPPAPTQLPTGGKVVAGQAGIVQNASTLNINQSSNRAAIDWTTFNVGAQAQVNFNQPGANSVTLNRVLDANPSQIFGKITAPGQVYLTNPGGVYFAPGASVDVGGLVATTHRISVDDFMAGKTTFDRNGATGSVINEGQLKAALGGYIALLAPEVRNSGVIVANLGSVALAAGEVFELQFDGNNTLANIRVTPATIAALVENKSAVLAPGGLIILSAQAANTLQGSVVNSGTLAATGLSSTGGLIRLESGTGQTSVSGTVDVSSANGTGGRILATGKRVLIDDGARLDASGASGGGSILVGGSWQNSDPSVPQATDTFIAAGAVLDASATDKGNGGTVVAWSDVSNPLSVTRAYGSFEAKGGPNGGDGGRIETSGHWLDVAGITADASAPIGKSGEWLLDPFDVTITTDAIGASGTPYSNSFTPSATSKILASAIVASLDAGTSVTITTGTSGTDASNITVDSCTIAKTNNATGTPTLTLTATGDISYHGNITGTLAVVINADQFASYGGSTLAATGGVTFNLANKNNAPVKSSWVVISGTGGITKTGTGALKLGGISTYTGITSINGGKLEIINDDRNLGAAPDTPTPGKLVFNGGTLVLNKWYDGITINANRGILLNAGGGTIEEGADNNPGNTSIYNGVITGSGSFTRTNSSPVIDAGLSLGGANTYEGATYINSGRLLTASATALPQNTAVTVASGAKLDVNTANTTVGSIAGAGTILMNGGHVDHRRQQHRHHFQRRHHRFVRADQGGHGHADAFRHQCLQRCDFGQRRYAFSDSGWYGHGQYQPGRRYAGVDGQRGAWQPQRHFDGEQYDL